MDERKKRRIWQNFHKSPPEIRLFTIILCMFPRSLPQHLLDPVELFRYSVVIEIVYGGFHCSLN